MSSRVHVDSQGAGVTASNWESEHDGGHPGLAPAHGVNTPSEYIAGTLADRPRIQHLQPLRHFQHLVFLKRVKCNGIVV